MKIFVVNGNPRTIRIERKDQQDIEQLKQNLSFLEADEAERDYSQTADDSENRKQEEI